MARRKQRMCKDCGTDEIIHKNVSENVLDDVAVMLCSVCLHSRAQLQRLKEDKLSFPKLLAKIQKEVDTRVHSEIQGSSVLDMLRLNKYKGESYYSNIQNYWIDQLKQGVKI